MKINNFIPNVLVTLALTCLHIAGVVSSEDCSHCNATNSSSWTEHPKLARLIESKLETTTDGLTGCGHSLVFANWQEKTLRLSCPGKDPKDKYRWTQHNNIEDKSPEEREKFNQRRHSRHRLIISSPDKCIDPEKLFRTYSCATLSNNCMYFIHVIFRPLPKTTFPVEIPLGDSGKFDCRAVRCKRKDKSGEEVDSPFGPFSITWRGPHGQDLEENPLPAVTVTEQFDEQENQSHVNESTARRRRVPFKSTVRIHEATPQTAGIYECVLTSFDYTVSSTPDDRRTVDVDGINVTSDVYLKSGIRYAGFVHVHSKPTWYIAIPAGIILVLFVILAFLIRFCPERDDEADVDADDDEITEAKRSLIRKSDTPMPDTPDAAVAGKNGLKEREDKAQSSAESSRMTTDKKDD